MVIVIYILLSYALIAVFGKERKKLKRLKELRRKNGEDVSDDDEDWYQDLLKKALNYS